MNNKILLQDLAQGLAKRKGMSRKEAESFIHKVFEVIEERVMADGVVKVKGLGTFKINTVDSRESVNVATGERFIIDTHSRISFAPHPTLRDAVNRPFSDFETVVISDDVKTEDMEFIPPTDKPVEDISVPLEAASEPAVEAAVPVAEELPIEETAEPAEEPSETVVEPAPAPVVVQPATEESTSEPAVEPEPVAEKHEEEPVLKPTAQTTSSSKTAIIIGVLAVVVMVCVLFFVFWHPSAPTVDTVEITETVVTQGEATSEQPAATETQPAATPVLELTSEEAAEKYPQVENGEYLIVGTKEEYTLQKGDDLFKLSVGVYGDKKFAPYIIVYNDIKDPSHIEIGDVLKFPELRKKE